MTKILRFSLFFILLMLFLCPLKPIFGQSLDGLGKKKGVKITGSVNANMIGYGATNIASRRDPFNYFLSGSLNINVFGYAVPLSFSYSNAGKNFTQPFNQFVFSPQYKWVKTYIGTTSMTFSPYTLAGHVFSGAGVELSPKKWRIGIMAGRLKKAVPFSLGDSLNARSNENASYKRMGYALKLGYEGEKGGLSGNIFYAKDDVNSLPFIPFGTSLTPKQNIAVNFTAKKKFFKKLSAEMEYAISALNNNTNVSSDSVVKSSNFIAAILPNNPTTQYFDAFSGALGYQAEKMGVQLKYERIAPDYQSLGAYFFNNDMENVTIAPNAVLFKGKLTVNGSVGLQKNNLNKLKSSQTNRTIGNISLSFAPNPKLSTSLNFSNFTTFTKVIPAQQDPYLRNNADTLNFYQVSTSLDANTSYVFGEKTAKKSIIFSISYQQSKDKAASATGANNLNNVYTSNLSYSQLLKAPKIQMSAAINYFLNQNTGVSSSFVGPSLSLSKKFDKIQLTCSNAYNANFNQVLLPAVVGKEQQVKKVFSDVWNTRIGIVVKIGEKAPPEKKVESIDGVAAKTPAKAAKKTPHSLNFSMQRMQRFKGSASQPAFTEYTGTINYTYAF